MAKLEKKKGYKKKRTVLENIWMFFAIILAVGMALGLLAPIFMV